MKKFLSFILLLVIALMFTGTSVYAKSVTPKIKVDNKEIKTESKPYMKGNEIIIPVKKTFEALGAKVEYDKKSNIVLIKLNDTRIELPIGKKEFYVYKESDKAKRQTFKLTTAIKRDKNVTFIEGKKLFECLGFKFSWDSKNKIFNITKPNSIDLTKDIPYTVISRDNIKDIKNVAKWYDDHYKKSGIHFKKHADVMYVLVSAGKKPTGGYSVGIEKISYKTEKKAYVNAYVKKPSADMMVIQVESYPHILIKITGNKQLDKVEGKIEEKKEDTKPTPPTPPKPPTPPTPPTPFTPPTPPTQPTQPAKVTYQEISFDYIKYNEAMVKWYNENNQKKGINFTRLGNYVYILIGAGEKPTGGYSISIDEVILSSSDTVSIKARVIPPASNASVIMVISYPSKFIRIESTTIKNVVGEITDTTKLYDKWITLEDSKVSLVELLDQDLIKIRDITGSERSSIIKAFNDATVDDSFYIMMITGKILKITTTDGYVLTFTSYGSENNVVVTIEKDKESKTFHLKAPVIAKLLGK